MADVRRRRVPRQRQDDSETLGEEGQEGAVSARSDAGSASDADSDTIFDKEEETDEYESAEEAHDQEAVAGTEATDIPLGDDRADEQDEEEVREGEEDGEEEEGEEEEEEGERSGRGGSGEEEEVGNEEEGDAEDADVKEEKDLDADQDLKNPAYIPRRGPFFMHDVRSMEEAKEEGEEGKEQRPEKKLWKEDNKWLHDCYSEEEQAPKPRAEMVQVYGYDVRSSTELPKTGSSRQYRRAPRGQRPGRGRRQYPPRDRYDGQPDTRPSWRGGRTQGAGGSSSGYDRAEQSSAPAQEEEYNPRRSVDDDHRSPADERSERRVDASQSQRNGEDDQAQQGRDRPWSGRSGGRGRGRGVRGQGRAGYEPRGGGGVGHESGADAAPIPHKTEWINSSSGRRDQAGGPRRERDYRSSEPDSRRQRVPAMEDFPALGGSGQAKPDPPQPAREARSYQRDRHQRAAVRQEPAAHQRPEGDWAKVVTRTGIPKAREEVRERKPQHEPSQPRPALLPTPPSTEKVELLQDGIPAGSRSQADKREPPKPKRYSSQRQRPPADTPPISQAPPPISQAPPPISQAPPPAFYKGEAGQAPPTGYQRQGNTPPATSSPQRLSGGATPPHSLPTTAAPMSIQGGAMAPPSQAMPGGVIPQGIILQGDVPLHPGMQHPSPTHIANPPIIHPAAMRHQPPLPQGSLPPPTHFVVNYRATPGQQYQLNTPVPMQPFPQVTVPSMTPPAPHPIPPPLAQPNQSLPLQVQPLLPQQGQPPPGQPPPGQPLPPPGSSGALPLPTSGPPSQTFGGVTYYSPEQQQQGLKRVQPKRTVNPIRIEEPPQRSKRQSEQYQDSQEEIAQQQELQLQQQQHQEQQQQQQQQHQAAVAGNG